MTIIQWLSGTNGQLLSSSAVIVILILMLLMSVRLYGSYRNKGIYMLLIGAIALAIMKFCILLVLPYPGTAASGWSPPTWLYMAALLLQICSFIIINFVFLKLYTPRSAGLKVVPFIVMAALAIIAAAANGLVATSQSFSDNGLYPVLDFYSLVIVCLIMLDTRSTNMTGKYRASLIVFFVAELARLAESYIFNGTQQWLIAASQLLPILYFALLFQLLFEWVIERLMSTYQSSIVDGLTGLYNRRHFISKSQQIQSRSKSIAVLFCDIDNFKKLNDTHGHHKADGVLKQVSEIIREETSGIGAAGRYGGEELLACIGTDRVKADVVAEAIRNRVEQESLVTISVGVCMTKEAYDIQELIKLADEAMYQSKTTGKNKVTYVKAPSAKARSKAQ